ncbi:MAG: DUF3298 domain-containing protein [Sphingobacteriaceae bacterium]
MILTKHGASAKSISTKKPVLLVLLVIGLCFGCNQSQNTGSETTTTRDTLNYTYKNIKERAASCGDQPDSNCTVASFFYPAFDPAQQKLEDSVQRKLITLYNTEKASQTLPEQAKKFVADHEAFIKSDPRGNQVWTLDGKAKVLRQDSSLITIAVNGYSYAGGAHGSSGFFFVNWNTRADQQIALKDLLDAGYLEKLNQVAEHIFRQNEQLSDTVSLANSYFFENDRFHLNDNFLVTPEGLKFIYNQYEIKPYVAGITELIIPYAEILPLISKNSILQQFINHNAGF